MPRNPTRFDKRSNLTERQLKSFDQMYSDHHNYSIEDIIERFGINHGIVLELAKERNLKLRKGGH